VSKIYVAYIALLFTSIYHFEIYSHTVYDKIYDVKSAIYLKYMKIYGHEMFSLLKKGRQYILIIVIPISFPLYIGYNI